MRQSFSFKNRQGTHGVFQKSGNTIYYYLDNNHFPIQGTAQWEQWTQQVDGGYLKGDKETPTVDSISFFLLRYAETINHEVFELTEIESPGEYFPRINRGNIDFNYINDSFHLDMRSYRNIQNSLDDLFNVIEPDKKNFSSYGHKIRELLIISCTEVEYLLLKALTENGYTKKSIYKTIDYINCLTLFRLNEYKATLTQYSNIKIFSPFDGWDRNSPTRSLRWYDAYNAVKHNRGDNIAEANFEHVLDSVAAIHILLEAQYGGKIFDKFHQRSDDKSLFTTTAAPTWIPLEMSIPIFEGPSGKAKWTHSREYYSIHPLSKKQTMPHKS
ncbi:hypothetical protein D3C73_575220 [compost metagenome]